MAEEPLSVTEVAHLNVLDLKGTFKERSTPVDDQQAGVTYSSSGVEGMGDASLADTTGITSPAAPAGADDEHGAETGQVQADNHTVNGGSEPGVPAPSGSLGDGSGVTAAVESLGVSPNPAAPTAPHTDLGGSGLAPVSASPENSAAAQDLMESEARNGLAALETDEAVASALPTTGAASGSGVDSCGGADAGHHPSSAGGSVASPSPSVPPTNSTPSPPNFTPSPSGIEAAKARAPPPSASQDTYAYEEEQERVAMLKALHQPMRKWFNQDGGAMRARYGNFPLFWQDLASWPHMKEVKKLYLVATEERDTSQSASAHDEPTSADAGAGAEVTGAGATAEAAADVGASGSAGAGASSERVDRETEGASAMPSGGSVASSSPDGPKSVDGGEGGDDAKKKKRKNRWGDATRKTRFADREEEEDDADADADAAAASNKRKSRWSVETTATSPVLPGAAKGVIPGMPVNLSQEQIQETLVLQMRLQQVNEKLATVAQDAVTRSQDPDRSPSPPPRYDSNGVRTNTRDVRMREALNKERTKVIEEMMKLNPMFRPPADFVKTKPHRKLYIPTEEYPGYNFIGLIIGPRGNTQKRMERETDCKIAIRGKGSVKEGARRGPKAIDEDDELHVYISGDTEENVEKAAKEVSMLLRPLDDEQNEHKQKQLRELALINGTLREEDYCNICGEKGHRQFECPKRAQTRSATVEVRCALCGDTSHPTRDCLLHKSQQKAGQPAHEASLDKEYLSFMAELGDGDAAAAPAGPGNSGTSAGSTGGPTSGPGGGKEIISGAGPNSSSRPAPITNHYVWEPPKMAASPHGSGPPSGPMGGGPGMGGGGPRAGGPPMGYHKKHSQHGQSSGPPYAQNSHPPPGQPRSPFSRNSGNGSSSGGGGGGGSGGMMPPPPMAPPPPPVPPVPPVPPSGGGMMPPPVPPSQPPLPPSSSTGPSVPGSPQPGSSPTPTPAGGKYSHVPPPLPPGGMYNQPMPPPLPGAYSYPPPLPVGPSGWGAVPPPPLPPSNSGYVPPPLPPGGPNMGPPWHGYGQQSYTPPPLPAEAGGDQAHGGQVSDGGSGSHFAGSNPPLPPPPLPGQPPLPPG